MQEGAFKNICMVKEGEIKPLKPELFERNKAYFEGKMFDLYMVEREEKHSDSARGFYYGIIIRKVCMSTEMFGGWDADEIHDFFADMFLTEYYPKVINGVERIIPRRISLGGMSKKNLWGFTEKVIRWLAQHDIPVPDPQEVYHRESDKL